MDQIAEIRSIYGVIYETGDAGYLYQFRVTIWHAGAIRNFTLQVGGKVTDRGDKEKRKAIAQRLWLEHRLLWHRAHQFTNLPEPNRTWLLEKTSQRTSNRLASPTTCSETAARVRR